MTQMAGERLFELFDIALDTSSPYTIPSRGDLEKDDILNSPGYKHLLEKGLIPPPVKKADSSWFNEGTGIEPEGFDSVPDYLKNKLRENQWRDELKKNQDAGLEVTPVSGPVSSWLPSNSPLLAHVNADGTAHDWKDPSHGGIPAPGGFVDPHGRRGGLTWADGRAKYSQEDVIRKIRDGSMHGDILQNDDRFWAPNTKPGDGSYMTPEAQELIKQIWNEKDAL